MSEELAYSIHLGSDKNRKNKSKKIAETNQSGEINNILDNLKPTPFNKNNKVISNEDIEIIQNYTKDVKDTNKLIHNVNDLNILIEDFENSYKDVVRENNSLKYQIEFKDFWYAIMDRFQRKIGFDKDEQYKYVSEDLHKAGIFSDDEFEIATNALRKVKHREFPAEKTKEKNDMNLN